MKQLLITLFTVAFIASCKSSTGTDEPQKTGQIGNWTLYSDQHAEYNYNTSSKSIPHTYSNDTLVIHAEGLQGLTIYQNNPGQLTYFDDNAPSWMPHADVWFAFNDNDMFKADSAGAVGWRDNDLTHLTVLTSIHRLSNQGNEPTDFYVNFSDSSHQVVYDFKVSGIDSTMTKFGF